MSTESLHTKILDKIKDQKPIASWRFQFVAFLTILFLTILLSTSVLLLTFFFWDIFDAGNFSPKEWLSFLGTGLFELVLVVLLLTGIIYYLYRRTDFVFVKNRILVLFGILAIILGASATGILAVQNIPQLNRTFQSVSQRLEDGGYRKGRRDGGRHGQPKVPRVNQDIRRKK